MATKMPANELGFLLDESARFERDRRSLLLNATEIGGKVTAQ